MVLTEQDIVRHNYLIKIRSIIRSTSHSINRIFDYKKTVKFSTRLRDPVGQGRRCLYESIAFAWFLIRVVHDDMSSSTASTPSSSERMPKHDTSYLSLREISALIVTYNCNSKIVPDAHVVSEMLREKGVGLGSNRVQYDKDELLHHDIVVFGLQEMVKLDANNVVLSGELSAKRVGQWIKLIETALNETENFLNDSLKYNIPDGDSSSLNDASDIERISSTSCVSTLTSSTELPESISFKINQLSLRPVSATLNTRNSDNMNNIMNKVRNERLLSLSDDENDELSISSTAKREKDSEILSYFGGTNASSPINTFASMTKSFEEATIPSNKSNSNLSSNDDPHQTRYECKGYQNMVGITIFLFAKKEISPHIRNVQCGVLARGIGGVLGNKGAACIRMDLYDTSVCFVCAHMAASRNQLAKRNDDYNAIMLEKVFKGHKSEGNKEDLLDKMVSMFGSTDTESPYNRVKVNLENVRKKIHAHIDNVRCDAANTGGDNGDVLNFKLDPRSKEDLWMSVDDHDIVIYMGDLNYRLTKEVELDEVYSFIGQYYDAPSDPLALPYLLNFDQLNSEKLKKNIFKEFNEGSIHFPPTYQYIPGSSTYDQRPDHKMRMPAWCDRILWRVGKSGFESREVNGKDQRYKLRTKLDAYLFPCREEVDQVTYVACDNGLISDHKAVKSVMTLKVKDINKELLELFLQKTGKSIGDPSIPLTFRPGTDFLNAHTVRKPLLLTPGYVSLYTVPPKYSQQEIKVTIADPLVDKNEYKISVRPCGNTFPPWLIISTASGYVSSVKHAKFKFAVKVDQSKAYLEYSQLDKFRAQSDTFRSVTGFEKKIPEVSTYILITIESVVAASDKLNIEQDLLLPVKCVLGPCPDGEAW